MQKTTVQEQNEVIGKLTSCLQQAKQDQDDLQEEALRVAGQIHYLQLQLHQVCLYSHFYFLTKRVRRSLKYECKNILSLS